jgi:SAM-dependent methyltransferase
VVPGLPRLYRDLADWWPLLSAPAGYRGEAESFRQTLLAACAAPPRTLLELGSGGGNTASHLKHDFRLTLVDAAPRMLAVSRRANPECEHVLGDMRHVRLGRLFDAVFIHDAIMYMTTERDLLRAMRTAFAHCRAGGAVVIAPDNVRDHFAARTWHGGHDGAGRALRYLEWTWDPDPRDQSYVVDMMYALRDRGGRMRVVRDRHVYGLFPVRTWRGLLRRAGFLPRVVTDRWNREVFVGRKPARQRMRR